MTKTLYHGSYARIEEIDLSFCRTKRDFGRGFYVTAIRSQAEYWAVRKGRWRNTKGAVTEFGFHEELIRILKLNVLRFDGYTEEWLDFIVANRVNDSEQQTHDYDMVEGPVADDDVANRVGDFMNGKVSKGQFLKELEHKTPTHKICFCTEQSLHVLITPRARINSAFIHIDRDILKALIIDYGKTEAEAMDLYYTSKTYTQLADESTGLYLKPWQEVYQMLQTELLSK